MQKINITLSFEDEKMEALEFSLKKEKTSVQAQMDKALRELYEQTVPEAVREYLDRKCAPAARPKRPARTSVPNHKTVVTASEGGSQHEEP